MHVTSYSHGLEFETGRRVQAANKKASKANAVQNVTSRALQKWEKPEVNQVKVNVDASVVGGQDWFAIGMVIRNHQGQYMLGKVMRFAGHVSVMEAELTGIQEAMLWSQEMASAEAKVTIESDSLLSVKAINQGHSNLLELSDLVQHCRDILKNNNRIIISHVKKQVNKVAHYLAKFSCELNDFILYTSPPSALLETILADDLKF